MELTDYTANEINVQCKQMIIKQLVLTARTKEKKKKKETLSDLKRSVNDDSVQYFLVKTWF